MEKYLKSKTRISKLIDVIIKHPWKVLLASLSAILLMSTMLGSIRADTSYRIWMHEDDPLLKKYDAFERRFGNDDGVCLLINSKSGIFDKNSIELIQKLTKEMWMVHDVIRVDSLTNYNWIHGTKDEIRVDPLFESDNGELTDEFLEERKKIALSDEDIPGYLVSKDAKSSVIYASIKPALVNYKHVINQFVSLDEVLNTAVSFKAMTGEVEHKNTQEINKYISAIKQERDNHYRKMIEKIREKEMREKRSLHFNNVILIVEGLGKVEYTLQEKYDIDLEKLAEKDYQDLIDQLLISQKKESADYQKIIAGIRKVKEKYEHETDHSILIVGNAFLNDSLREAMYHDMNTIIPIVLAMIIIFLFVTFRKLWGYSTTVGMLQSFKGILYSLLIIIISIVFTFSIMGLLKIKFTNITSIVPQILIAICIADAVHILVTFFQFLKKGLAKNDALKISLSKNFIPTLLTSISTAIGFFSLSFSKVAPLANLGVISGFGIIAAWVFTYTVLGSLLAILPARVKVNKEHDDTKNGLDFEPGSFSVRYTNFIYKRRKSIIAAFSSIIVLGVFLCLQLEVNTNPFEMFKKGSEIRNGLESMEKLVGGAMRFEIDIDTGTPEGIKDPAILKKVEKFQNWLEEKRDVHGNKFVTKTVSIINILKSTHRILHDGDDAYYKIADTKGEISDELFLYTMNLPQGMNINDRISINNDSIRLSVIVTIHDAKTQLIEFAAIDKKAAEMGLNAHVTGKQRVFMDIQPYMLQTYIISILTAIALMSIILIFALKSVKFGLLAMLPNLMPLMLGASLVRLLGYDLDMGHILVFSICLGIAVDDTIHFLANHKNNLNQGDSVNESIARICTYTAPALVSTTVILVASFGSFMLASFIPNENFGIFTAFILSIALFADMVFLPALLMVIDRGPSDDTSYNAENDNMEEVLDEEKEQEEVLV